VSSDPSARAYGRRAEALAKEDTLPAFVAELLRRSRLGGFRRRHKRDHGCPSSAVVCYGGWISRGAPLKHSPFPIDHSFIVCCMIGPALE
jgi:hypothetical protein